MSTYTRKQTARHPVNTNIVHTLPDEVAQNAGNMGALQRYSQTGQAFLAQRSDGSLFYAKLVPELSSGTDIVIIPA